MAFDTLLGMPERDHREVIERLSVRGVVLRNNEVLMIKLNQGQLQFPGGGIQVGESHQDTLFREMLEETGYQCINTIAYLGKTLERREDLYEKGKLFEMTSYYYHVSVDPKPVGQTLEAYEVALGLTPVWMEPTQAIFEIETMRKALNDSDTWMLRDAFVLEYIRKNNMILEAKMPLMNLHTERLILMPVTLDITQDLMKGTYDEISKLGISTDANWPTPDTRDILPIINHALEQNPEPSGFEFWMIVEKESRSIIGDIGFHGKPSASGEVEVGFGFVESMRGKGYGYEALMAILNWLETQESVQQVKANCLVDNQASIGLLRKAGMNEVHRNETYIFWDKAIDNAGRR